MLIKSSRPWDLPDHAVSPRESWLSRRRLVASLAAAGLVACRRGGADGSPGQEVPNESPLSLPPFKRSERASIGRPDTPRGHAARHTVYFEFSTRKQDVWRRARGFQIRPWTVELTGELHAPTTLDIDSLLNSFPLEERRYRFRCAEGWSMVVPWVGLPLRALLDRVRPTSHARYVRFSSFHRPTQALGQLTQPWYPWPYTEGLRLDEACNELSMLVVGAYGEALPTQSGAPLRLIVPWKYGYKSIKGITRIELLRERPRTLWNAVAPREYSFLANVDPGVPHPYWSQATERDLATSEELQTRPFNGYGAQVAELYAS